MQYVTVYDGCRIMKFKKIMLVAIVLLAILTLGSVSASQDSDSLAVNDVGDDSVLSSPSVNDIDLLSDDGNSTGYYSGNSTFVPYDNESDEEDIANRITISS